ncbi:MAG: ABC transporter permease [Cytophagaceae bacterium]
MNLYYFISKRINKSRKGSFSSVVGVIATWSIMFGIAVMIISFSILEGFKNKIQNKIFSFGSHMQVTKYDLHKSYEESPLSTRTDLFMHPEKVSEISHIQAYSMKPGLLKTKEEVMGVVMKGVGRDFGLDRFRENIVEGSFIEFKDSTYSQDILISKKIADKMRLKTGDSVLMFFVQYPPRFKKLAIKGLYETGLEELDDQVIIGDLRLNQNLNNWSDTLVGGYEIYIDNFARLDEVSQKVFEEMDYDMQLEKINDKYLQIFDWLMLLRRNVRIFLVLILLVACLNMMSTIFIMIMERTNMIGLLKALGARNGQVHAIFLFNGMAIILKGMLYGNIIGLGFCALQYYFKIIPLDPENYYMSSVPIEWNWLSVLLLNVLILVMISLVLVLPVVIISRISPIKSIKFN